jgi:hypothetical protein
MSHFWRSLQPWLWPIIILASIVVVILFTFVNPGTSMQGIAILWFITLCPGMSLVPLLKLEHVIIELTLGIALSLSIDAIVVGIFLYAGQWSPPITLLVIMGICIVGVPTQIVQIFRVNKSIIT